MSRPVALLVNPAPVANPISLAYIAAYLKGRGYGAELLDLGTTPPSAASLEATMRRLDPAVVGISAYQRWMPEALGMARLAKRLSSARVILGGPQTPGMPDRALAQMPDVDAICRSEGEVVMRALVEALEGGRDLDAVPGISYRAGDDVVTTLAPEAPEDLDEYPSPYLDGTLPVVPGRKAILFTSRGCTKACGFCVTPFLSRHRLRCHSIDRILEELRYLSDRGVRRFWFADPLLSASRSRCQALFEAILAAGLPGEISCETRADLVDDGLLALMQRAGVRSLAYGLESSSQDVLHRNRKRQDVGRFFSVVERTRALGIQVELFHIRGLPGDTRDSVMGTFDAVRGLGRLLDGNSRGNRYQLYFGSPDSRSPERAGLVVRPEVNDDRYPAYLSAGAHVRPRTLPPEDLETVAARHEAEERLAALARRAAPCRALGMSLRRTASLPWDALGVLDEAFEGPSLALFGPGSSSPDRTARVLRGIAFDGTAVFLDPERCPLARPELVEILLAHLRSAEIFRHATVAVTVPWRSWRADPGSVLGLFSGLAEPTPFHLTLEGAPPVRPPCRVIALLDVTGAGAAAGDALALERGLADALPGVRAFPFAVVEGERAVEDLAIGLMGLPSMPLVVLAPEAETSRLEALHAESDLVPPIHVLGFGTIPLAPRRVRELEVEAGPRPASGWVVARASLLAPWRDAPPAGEFHPDAPETSPPRPAVPRGAGLPPDGSTVLGRHPRAAFGRIDGAFCAVSGSRLHLFHPPWAEALERMVEAPGPISDLAIDAPNRSVLAWCERLVAARILEPCSH